MFWQHSMWDLSSPARDPTCAPLHWNVDSFFFFFRIWILNHWTTREVPLTTPFKRGPHLSLCLLPSLMLFHSTVT